jgi:hypothetical protein
MRFINQSAICAIAFTWLAIGCNASNREADSTKQQLQQVTSERDSLRAQLDTAKRENAAAQQQIAQLTSAAAATPANETTTAQNEKMSHPPKHGAAVEAKRQKISAKHRAM